MIEEIFGDITKTNIAVGALCLLVLWSIVRRIDEERRINSLGKRAPQVKAY
ncbi:hypothetical protein V494_05674, partial [Pseudogymnoascus sp. VKM F-4513 (FW-928)]